MKTLQILITPILIVLAVSMFTACSDSSSNAEVVDTSKYIINATENRDVPLNAQILSVSEEEAKVKLTRDIEAETVNVYVVEGSVEVTEASAEAL